MCNDWFTFELHLNWTDRENERGRERIWSMGKMQIKQNVKVFPHGISFCIFNVKLNSKKNVFIFIDGELLVGKGFSVSLSFSPSRLPDHAILYFRTISYTMVCSTNWGQILKSINHNHRIEWNCWNVANEKENTWNMRNFLIVFANSIQMDGQEKC